MSSTPLRTMVLRWPSNAAAAATRFSTARIARPRPSAFYSTTSSVSSTARPSRFLTRPSSALPACQPCRATVAARFALTTSTTTQSRRSNSDLASSAQRSVNASDNRTGKSLGTAPGSTGPSSSAATEVPPSRPGSETPTGVLTWDSFFALRLRRRRVQLFFSVINSAVVGMTGMAALSMGLAEPMMKQVPLDPFLTLGLATMACIALGWLTGPSVGTALFYQRNKSVMPQMKRKESEFLEKIKKNRADPTNSSTSNPVPDFYGEKVQSVSGYRQWLKDQRAFTKKKTRSVL